MESKLMVLLAYYNSNDILFKEEQYVYREILNYDQSLLIEKIKERFNLYGFEEEQDGKKLLQLYN